jgi:hypothetical protein
MDARYFKVKEILEWPLALRRHRFEVIFEVQTIKRIYVMENRPSKRALHSMSSSP